MQKRLTPQHPLENNCFADAEEINTPVSSLSIGGQPLCNLRFSDDISLLEGSEEELQQLTERLEETPAVYDILISSNKSKILVNSVKPRPSSNVWMDRKMSEEVDEFKYLGSTQTKDGISIMEVKIRLAQAYSALRSQTMLWENKAISFLTKIKLNSTNHL